MRKIHIQIGFRTIKTVIAIILAMIVAGRFGTTADKLIFSMIGAMSAVGLTFKESISNATSTIFGVILGAVVGLCLGSFGINYLISIAIGIILIITIYNILRIEDSPSLPCFILVMICTSANISPITYATGRIADTAIGLGIGILVNLLIFPYDNSRKIKDTIHSLDKEVIEFLEDMFDGDSNIPNTDKLNKKLKNLETQLSIFEDQLFIIHNKDKKFKLEQFKKCGRKARELIARLQILSNIDKPGRLNDESRRRLRACGANILDNRELDSVMELDVVTNYHIRQILSIRQELLRILKDYE